jgi:hypothetical protein
MLKIFALEYLEKELYYKVFEDCWMVFGYERALINNQLSFMDVKDKYDREFLSSRAFSENAYTILKSSNYCNLLYNIMQFGFGLQKLLESSLY